ncbi:MAG: ADP-glyceromanno-heptose 6-epimerase [Bacteroidota bacterium]
MIVVTGAAGFIGSCLINKLNNKGHCDIVAVDDFSRQDKLPNLNNKIIEQKIERTKFFDWFDKHATEVKFVFHIGARTDTTEFNTSVFDELNLNYSKAMWERCTKYNVPLVYASSAATYGLGELGYTDDHSIIEVLKPLNPYGESKNNFDKWVLKQTNQPPHWFGLKFFNVYGPNEYHKARMASVIFHTFRQVKENGKVKLFRSHNPQFEDGKQLRDFVYVKDVVNVCYFLMSHIIDSGIYNLGTGKARSFVDLATQTFVSMQQEVNIEFIDTPLDIRDKYQYFTEANMQKLISAGYNQPFFSLESGIDDYVKTYLISGSYY